MDNKKRDQRGEPDQDMQQHTAGGHPLRKLKQQTFEEFEQEFAKYDKPCVQLVNKRRTEPEPVKEGPAQQPTMSLPLIQPIMERAQTTETPASNDIERPKKKASLFAQRLQSKKAKEKVAAESTSTGFPELFKIEAPSQVQKHEETKVVQSPVVDSEIQEIHQENRKKIKEMSRRDVEQELEELKSSLSPKLLEKLKKLGGAGPLITKQSPQAQPLQVKPAKKATEEKKAADSRPIEMHEVSKAVSDAAISQIKTTNYLKHLRFNINGEIQHLTEIPEQTDDNVKTINYLEDEDFQGLDVKLYSVKELVNLLGSTDLYQRSFALRLLTSGLLRNENLSLNDLYESILNPDHTHILERLLQITQTTQRLDVTLNLLEAYSALFERQYSQVVKERDESLVLNGSWLWKNNMRVHNVQLRDFLDKGDAVKVFRKIMDGEGNNVKGLLKKVIMVIDQYLFGSDKDQRSGQIETALNLMSFISDFDKDIFHLVHSAIADKYSAALCTFALNHSHNSVLYALLSLLATLLTHSHSLTSYQALSDISLQSHLISHTLEHLTESGTQLLIVPYLKSILLKLTYNPGTSTTQVLSQDFIVEIFKKAQDTEQMLPLLCSLVEIQGSQLSGMLVRIMEQRYIVDGEACSFRLAVKGIEMCQDVQSKVQWVQLAMKGQKSWFEKVEVMRASKAAEGYDEVMRECEKRLQDLENIETNKRIVELTRFSGVKDYVAELIISKKVKRSQVMSHIYTLLRLQSRNDEYLLMLLLSKYLFKGKDNEELDTLTNFFLGYCQSEGQTYEVSEPNFSGKRHPVRHSQAVIHQMPQHEIFLPLMDDWFFRPLLFINKIDDKNLQSLAATIFKHLDHEFSASQSQCEKIYRVNKSQVVLLITHLLTDEGLKFNKDAKTAMIYFIQHNFYPLAPAQDKLRVMSFTLDVKNDFFLQTYKEVFLSDSVSSKIALFFTQNSPDENPILLFVLILLLQTQSKPGQKLNNLDFRKGLLSELSETYLCLMRAEPDHFKHTIDDAAFQMLYAIDPKDAVEVQYYTTFLGKMDRALTEFPAIVQTLLKQSFLYKLVSFNFTNAQ